MHSYTRKRIAQCILNKIITFFRLNIYRFKLLHSLMRSINLVQKSVFTIKFTAITVKIFKRLINLYRTTNSNGICAMDIK